MWVSMSREGRGGHQEDLSWRALGSYLSVLSPEKNIFRLRSHPNRVVVHPRSSGVMERVGVVTRRI